MSSDAEEPARPTTEGGESQPAGESERQQGVESASTAASGDSSSTPATTSTGDEEADSGLHVGRGVVAFLVTATYTVGAAVAALVPPVVLWGGGLNVTVWTGVLVVGVVVAAWFGFDVGQRVLSLHRVVAFVLIAWVVLVALGGLLEGVLVPTFDVAALDIYLGRVVVFAVATVAAAWLTYGGGWTRARSRVGAGGNQQS